VRKVPAESIAAQFRPLEGFQPQSVSLDEAAGGVNSVIEVAAFSGLRGKAEAVPLHGFDVRARYGAG